MPPSGKGKKGILLVGEGPGYEEDKVNKQFRGQAGQKLQFHIRKHGFDFEEDFWLDNALGCRPIEDPTNPNSGNRTPTKDEIIWCRHRFLKNIETLKPKAVILMGASPVTSFLLDRTHPIRKNLNIGRWRGLRFPDLKSQAWIYSTYHPSAVNRNPELEHIFSRDLRFALLEALSGNLPAIENIPWETKVEGITDFDHLHDNLRTIAMSDNLSISVDYETTGLKPFEEGHKIVSIGIGLNGKAYAFPYSYPGMWNPQQKQQIKTLWKTILNKPSIRMRVHNLIFEEKWHKVIFGTQGQGWEWDSMQAAHIIDERDEFTSLAMQTFLHWGYEYGESIDPYKKPAPNSKFNRMMEAPLDELLEYNALDALFTWMLPDKQKNELKIQGEHELTIAYNLWEDSAITVSDLETTGLFMDKIYYEDQADKLDKRINFLLDRLENSKEARKFSEEIGRKIVVTSDDDLAKLFYTILGYPIIRRTAKEGKGSVDEEAIESFGTNFAHDLLKMKKLSKVRNTYIGQFLRETIEYNDPEFGNSWMMFPNFPIHLVRTYRGSSEKPNFHNIPQRDPAAKKITRSGIISPPGRKINTADYGSMEVRIIACYFKDSVLLKECRNNEDPHGMWASELKLDDQKPWGQARYDAKNAFVFPLFYGSYYFSIWKDLTSRGYILTEGAVRRVESQFWKKYRETKKAQEDLILFYKRYGYIPLLWGHRRRGHLVKNKIFNTPIQGSAFHCLLWSLNKIRKLREKEGWLTRVPAQIHDEIFFYTEPSEEKHIITASTKIMTEDIRKENPFISVPLLAEWGTSPINGSWYEVKDIKDLDTYLKEL